ncbi:MAG TPA: mechanosensitive ion channel family protein [Candidatus Woesearchaeota archaeon]|nr:MAG: mechanosensitive ion channel family protein [Candidatus Woesearchaeota archaeon]HDD70588.1 mechanosensitive ion channel family protein [Candidatus Woesearchaeota archaeon]
MAIPEFLMKAYFDNTLYQYLIFLVTVAAAVIFSRIIYWGIQKFVKKIAAKSKNRFDDILISVSEKPVVVYIILFGVHIGWGMLSFPNFQKIPVYYGHLMYMSVVLVTAWFVSKLLRGIIDTYLKPFAAKTTTDLDDHLIPIIGKLVNIFAFVIAIIMILEHFGQEIGPLLAGMGIGGLAFALAAKDLLSNLFGSITIIFDKPFKVGQRIKLDGFDGFVEEINLRTTRLRTLEGRKLYVPNAKFTESIVENVSQEWARKVKFEIGLTYDTNAVKLKKAKEIIRKILIGHKDVNSEKVFVHFTEFGAYSKNITVIYWITDKDNILKVKDDVNMKIMQAFDRAKIEMAFPTQTVEIKKSK